MTYNAAPSRRPERRIRLVSVSVRKTSQGATQGARGPLRLPITVCVVKSREGRQKLGHLGLEHPFRPLNILRQAQVCFAQLSFNTVRRQQAGAQLTDEKLLDRAAAEACQLLLGLGDSRGGLGASGVRLR